MNNRKAQFEYSSYDQWVHTMKIRVYQLTHHVLLNTVISTASYNLLLILETIQMIYYSIHPCLNFLFQNQVFKYFRIIVSYFQVNSVLDNSMVALAVLYIVLGMQLLILMQILIIVGKFKQTTLYIYSFRLLAYFAVFYTTLLHIPITNAYFVVLNCNASGFDCFQGVYYVHFVFAFIGVLIHALLFLYFNILFVELNPCSQIPFASPQQSVSIIKQFVKLALPIYTVFDINGKIDKVYITILSVTYVYLIVQRYKQPKPYNKSVTLTLVIQEIILLWITLVSFFTAFINYGNPEDIGFFYMIIGLPIMCVTFFHIMHLKNKKVLSLLMRQLQRDTDVETYILALVSLVESRKQPWSRMLLEGKLRMHSRVCTNKECTCRYMLQDSIKEDEIQYYWFKFLGYLLNEIRSGFSKSAKINILYAFILNDRLGNHFRALTELMLAEDNKPSLQEEFTMYHFKSLIQSKLADMEQKINENKGIDVNGIMIFQNTFIVFLNSIEKTVSYHIEYWRELLEANPDILKLKSVGQKITRRLEQTHNLYQRLQELNSNHIKCLRIYGTFLKEIVNDDDESTRILDRIQLLIKQFQNNKVQDQIRLKYGENANTCIITCSANFNNMGMVTNCNNEITRLLQFNKSDIMGININCIMPKIYASYHDQYMIDFVDSSKPKVMDKERILCCINTQQYLVPCSLMIKILPNLDEGIKMVGFLQDYSPNEQWHFLLVDGNTQMILGMTQTCSTLFGIPQSLMNNNTFKEKFTFDVLLPGIAQHENLEEGVVTYLDTTQLQEDYMQGIGESQSESSRSEDEDQFCEFPNDPLRQSADTRVQQFLQRPSKQLQIDQVSSDISPLFNRFQTVEFRKKKIDKLQRYKRYKVKVVLVTELKMGDYQLQTIKFMQIKEENEEEHIPPESNGSKPVLVKENEALQPVIEDCNSSRSSRTDNKQKELKEFKQMISSKTQPRSILILKRTVWFIMLLLLTLSTLIMAYRVIQSGDVKEGVKAINEGYWRHNLISDVVFNTRKLQMSYQKIGTHDSYNTIKTNLSYWVTQLQQLQYDLINVRLIMESRKGSKIQPLSYDTTFLLTSGDSETQSQLFDDAMMYFITSASQMNNATQSTFNDSYLSTDSGYKNFYFVMQNGYYVLRNGSDNIATNFYDFYSTLIEDYLIKFLIIMIIGIVCLTISSLVLIPIVSQVHDTNNKVLSLFGIIPVKDLKDLVAKCEVYMQGFLSNDADTPTNQQTQQNQIQTTGPNEQPLLLQNKEEKQDSESDGSKVHKQQKLLSSGQHSMSHVKQLSNLTSDGVPQIPMAVSQGQTKLESRISQKIALKEEVEEQESQKAHKLLNSQGSHKCTVTIQFIFFALLFISYFILDIILEMQFLHETQFMFDHLRNIQERPINIKYFVYLSVEQLIGKSDVEDYKTGFQNRLSEVERNISIQIQHTYPSQFDAYFALLADLSFSNVCNYAFSVNQFTLIQSDCLAVSQGLLTQGLKTSMASAILSCNDMIASSEYTYFNDLDTISNYVSNTCFYLTTNYLAAAADYLSYQEMIERVKFSVFLVFMFFVFIFCMTQYQNNLSEQIWQTKGLLNMVPLDIIAKHPQVKEQFVEGEILKAVQ